MRLAIITTHPIQYYAPIFKLLQQRNIIDVKVFYTLGNPEANFDMGFAKKITWDIPLLDGYNYEWVDNIAKKPGSFHPKGIINPNLVQRVNVYKPNALLVFGWNYDSHIKVMRYFKNKIPVYFRGDSTLLDRTNPLKNALKTLYLKWVYSHINHAFYTGANNKAYFKKYGLKDSQLSFAPHAIDNERFSADRSAEANKLRFKLGINDNNVLITFAGKLEPKKAPDLLLSAFIKLNNPNLHLLFTGNGKLEQSLKQLAAGSANVHFLDFQNQTDIPVVYQACDLFCLPSAGPGETWGLAVNEAMACNKAVLLSDKVGCATDLVQDQVNGAIFKSNDEGSLIENLEMLTRSKTKLKEYGKNSGLVIQNWNFITIAKAIEQKLLDETANNNK